MISAYSYIRFSSAPQEDGDSIRRQEGLRDAWLKRHPEVKLDTNKFLDRGVSGYTGKNRTEGDLGRFLDLVKQGRVASGSYLIVENLDRLSREDPLDAVVVLRDILKAGIRVVTLAPSEMEYKKGDDYMPLILALMEFGRGHSESRMKSSRIGEKKKEAKQAARETGKPMGKVAPAWLELVDGKYRVKDGAGETVRLIYQLCAEGKGVLAITRKLTADGVEPIARGVRADGQPMKRRGKKWITSYVAAILDNRATIGEYQPMSNGRPRTKDGDAIPDYFPPVVSLTEFDAAQKAIKSRKHRTGRPAKGAPHLFSGLLWCARDGCPIYFTTKSQRKYLISSRSVNGETGIVSFPMKEFQEAVLSQLRELSAADLFNDPAAEDVARLTGQLADAERKFGDAAKNWEENQDSDFWGKKVTEYERKCKTLKVELNEARHRAANPTANAWADLQETDPGRLRAALLRSIDRIYCVTAQRGEGKILACQVHFKDSDKRRSYLIHYIQGKGGFAPRDASYTCRSLDYLPGADKLDLTQPADVAALTTLLEHITLP